VVWQGSVGDRRPYADQTRQGLRMLLGAFRGGNPLGRIVGVPSLWPRHGEVLQEHAMGVHRPSEANTFVNTCRLAGSDLPQAGLWPTSGCGHSSRMALITRGRDVWHRLRCQESARYFAATSRLPGGRCCEAEYAPIAVKRGPNSLRFRLEREAGFTYLEPYRAVCPLPGNTQFCPSVHQARLLT